MTVKTSSRVTRRLLLRVVVVLALLSWVLPLAPQTAALTPVAAAAPSSADIPPGHADRILRVKLVEGASGDLQTLLPVEVLAVVQKIDPLFTLPKSKLKELKDKGDKKLKEEKVDLVQLLPDLSLWYEVKLRPEAVPETVVAQFDALSFVDIVEPAPLPVELPTDNFTSRKGYLTAAPGGIGAQYAWTVPGGTGAGITIYDLEYSWNRDHEDLSKARGLSLLLNSGDIAVDPFNSFDHGTAVLGQMIADNDGKGVTGIAYGASIGLAPTNTSALGYNVANAILLAAANGKAGDVILIEQQKCVCGLTCSSSSYANLGPSEAEGAVFQAIQTAVANGLVVVEAAGNGSVNLDQGACGVTFNRTSRDSGAILVGAGRPPSSGNDRQRENISCYGNRVDVQAWGSGVMTTGYGTYYMSWDDYNSDYTATFSGTSSASPMVAAAAAVLQGVAVQQNGKPLSPGQVRNLLVRTGSPQQGTISEHIGPRPDLQTAISSLPQSAPTYIVNSTANTTDHACTNAHCTLREAVEEANIDGVASTIVLVAGTTITLNTADNTDATYGANGLPVITSPIAINANGAVIERSSATGTPDFRLFQVGSGGTLKLNQAVLRNGKHTSAAGAAILNLGTTRVWGSTISSGSAASGGAIANQGTLTVVSSTFANNSATGSGGGINNNGTLTILGSTLAGNSAPTGGNINTLSSPTHKNTILVKGASGANCAGTTTLAAGSVANMADDASCGAATVKTTAEIALGSSLDLNGGLTPNLTLGSTSAAVDVGDNTACLDNLIVSRDQRGYDRFWDGPDTDTIKQCDIGAYEYGSIPLPYSPPPPSPDTTPPQFRITLTPTTPDGANDWYRSAVTPTAQARDGSGVIEVRCVLDPASPPTAYTDLPAEACPYMGDVPVTTDAAHTLYAAAMDWYGNQNTPVSVSFKIDATTPVITCPAPASFLLHSGEHPITVGPDDLDASVSALDEAAANVLSGVVTAESIGTQILTFTAYDMAGNRAVKECAYSVIYDFGGFYPPVAPDPALNPARAGSAIPLKFSLAGDQGLAVIAADYPASQPVDCDTLLPIGSLQAAQLPGSNVLRYDPGNGWYNYVWKTDKAWAGACRALIVRLVDGTQHLAYFRFQ